MPTLVYGNRVPLYRQVAQALRQRVRTGVYAAGRPLPTMRALALEYGVSVYAIQKAIYELEKERVVVTHHGKGIMVMEEKPCDQAAILFGMIEPYEHFMGFEGQIIRMAEEVFNQRNDFMVTRSSAGRAERERAIAEHYVKNGVKGLIVWPVENDPNGPFFTELAKTVPVVVIDRDVKNCAVPKIFYDLVRAGRNFCQYLLGPMKRRRLLVLMDTLDISPYHDFTAGLQQAAAQLGRKADVIIKPVPASELSGHFSVGDFSRVPKLAAQIEKWLRAEGCDAVFCYQDEFIDYVLTETGLYDRFPGLQMATMVTRDIYSRSQKFNQSHVLTGVLDQSKLIQTAANLLQDAVYGRIPPKDMPPIQVELVKDGAKIKVVPP
jgi:DNA-binding LacI/PurR family transcriptional regulator